MNDRLLGWYPVLLLLILAALTLWLDRKVQPPPQVRDGSTRHDPDFIIEKFAARRMNPDGSVRYAIVGDKMTHYPDDSSTHLEAPRFVHYDPKTAPVHINSREALVSRNGETVDFMGDVKIVRDAFADQQPMMLDTQFLHVIPDRDLASTDRALTMTQGPNHVEAVGMRYNHGSRFLELLSQVKVTYVSPISLPSSGR